MCLPATVNIVRIATPISPEHSSCSPGNAGEGLCHALCLAVIELMTPGKALFLEKTGHSLDNERRRYWAQQIVQFLKLH
jgi:hypothetical protein